MKSCPTCDTRYTDDTLRYCLQDGSRLTEYMESEMALGGTGEFSETPTVVSRRDADQSTVTQVRTVSAEKPNSRAALAVLGAVFAILFLSGIVGIGAWLYLRQNGSGNSNRATNVFVNTVPNIPRNVSPTAIPTRSPLPTMRQPSTPESVNTPGIQSAPVVDTDQIRRDVTERIGYWKGRAEALDLDGYMSNYASTVDYYNRANISRDAVRIDKSRAFSRFSLIRISITDLSVIVGQTGETASAIFDKEWVFVGAKTSSGKVRSQLNLQKINGYWLITGEHDLKVYYTH